MHETVAQKPIIKWNNNGQTVIGVSVFLQSRCVGLQIVVNYKVTCDHVKQILKRNHELSLVHFFWLVKQKTWA